MLYDVANASIIFSIFFDALRSFIKELLSKNRTIKMMILFFE